MTIPVDGRLTSLDPLTLPLTGGEIMEIVSPGNANLGNNYKVTTGQLAGFFGAFASFNTTLITNGATIGSPYMVAATDTRILFDKTIGSASYAVLPLASSMMFPFPVFFKDFKGDAVANPITVTFSGGQLCDGLSQLVIDTAYAFFSITPSPNGNSWYVSLN